MIDYFEFPHIGFKWLGNRSIELINKGEDVLFAYEEALGFCIGDIVHDKDGILAASVLLELVNHLVATNGWNENIIQQQLDYLYSIYGQFVSYNSYVISHDSKVTDKIFHRLRNSGGNTSNSGGYWSECAGSKIISIKDITVGYDSTLTESSDRSDVLPCTPDSHMIMFEFDNGCSVTIRTSGTEPKIKFYTEIAGKGNDNRDALSNKLQQFVNALIVEMLEPVANGLVF